MKRTHLTLDERYLIHACLVAQLSMNDMAAELNRHRSTLHAEIRRGRNPAGHYCPLHAQRGSESARALSVANAPRKSAAEWDKVEAQLKGGHSPEQISGRRQLLHDACPISPQAIYNATVRNDWTHHLYRSRVRRLLKRPAPRPWQGKSTSIHQRDPEVICALHWATGKPTVRSARSATNSAPWSWWSARACTSNSCCYPTARPRSPPSV
jgi:IS30 family transposase